jgi:hypothetical protein
MQPRTIVDAPPENRWTNEFLDQIRQTGDPLGDRTVAALFENGGLDSVNSLWNRLLKNEQIPPERLPREIQTYLQQSGGLPPWADPQLISEGEQFFINRGVFCLVSLLCGSLPECYVLRNEAAVLGTTRNLEQHAYRRIFETTQLIVAVMAPGGLERGGSGIVAAQKVRLMHSSIRHLILNTPRQPGLTGPPKSFSEAVQRMQPWDALKRGLPINQEDMAYTLLTFSYVILRAFRSMDIEVTADEAKAYLHSWNVVGYIMGVREDLLAHSLEEAELLFSKIKERQIGESDDGQALANALVDCTKKIIAHETGGILDRSITKHFPSIMMRLLLDKRTVKILKIKRLTFFEWIILTLIRILVTPFQSLYQKLVLALGSKFGALLVDDLTRIPRGWNRRLFQIPEQLRTAWKLKAARY